MKPADAKRPMTPLARGVARALRRSALRARHGPTARHTHPRAVQRQGRGAAAVTAAEAPPARAAHVTSVAYATSLLQGGPAAPRAVSDACEGSLPTAETCTRRGHPAGAHLRFVACSAGREVTDPPSRGFGGAQHGAPPWMATSGGSPYPRARRGGATVPRAHARKGRALPSQCTADAPDRPAHKSSGVAAVAPHAAVR